MLEDAELNEGAGNAIRKGAASTHHLVMWRDRTSNAITFHAGTISFGQALDTFRADENASLIVSVTMNAARQGLINLFADMGLSKPGSLEGLTWTPPSATIPTPTIAIASNGSAIMGKPHVVSGTASGGNGARVAAVEVQLTEATNPAFRTRFVSAVGRDTWSFEWTPPYAGTFSATARAINDFAATADSPASSITVQASTRLTDAADSYPMNVQPGNTTLVWVGTEFWAETSGQVSAVRFYNPTNRVYSVALVNLSSGQTWTASAATTATAGWHSVAFSSPVPVVSNTRYAALYRAKHNEGFAYVPSGYAGAQVSPPLHAEAGRYSYGAAPTPSTQASTLYGVDVTFDDGGGFYSTAASWRGIWGPYTYSTVTDPLEVEVGTRFKSKSDGFVDGVRAYLPDAGNHAHELWQVAADGARTRLASTTATGSGVGAWVTGLFAVPVRTFAGMTYLVTLRSWSGYAYTDAYIPFASSPLTYIDSNRQYCYRNPNTGVCCNDVGLSNCWNGGQATPWVANGPIHRYPVDPLYRPTATARQSFWPRSGVNPLEASLTTAGTPSSFSLGTVFRFPTTGLIEAVRFPSRTTQPFTVRVYLPGATGPTCSATATPVAENGSIWRTIRFASPCRVDQLNADYTVTFSGLNSIDYAWTPNVFGPSGAPPIARINTPTESTITAVQGVYGTQAPQRPTTNGYQNGSYFVDVMFKSTY